MSGEAASFQISRVMSDGPDDIVSRYFDEMGAISTLTRSEELTLTRRIEELSRLILHRLTTTAVIVRHFMSLYEDCTDDVQRWDEVFRIREVFKGGQSRKMSPRDRKRIASNVYRQMRILEEVDCHSDSSGSPDIRFLRRQFHYIRISSWLRKMDFSLESQEMLKDAYIQLVNRADDGDPEALADLGGDFPEAVIRAADLKRISGELKSAKNKLISANLRLVVSIGKRFANRGLPFSDILQEGNLGLIKAVDRFDYRKGYRFSTYATWWIQQSIIRAIAEQGRTVRIPQYITETVSKLNRLGARFIQENHREPTVEELAEVSANPAKNIHLYLNVIKIPFSLDMPIGEDEEGTLNEVLPDKSYRSPLEIALDLNLKERVRQLLDSLPDRDRIVVKMRFGIDSSREYTLEEIGKILGLTRERIRQIELDALRKIRLPAIQTHQNEEI
ncbi:sigma-70 family RNA polymerase sigma factor [bacterium]|nr:sigma-70 family RNA polymerase sigma factor [candidate division CSSED10-310 bacterium]